jgi:hypothetical protein
MVPIPLEKAVEDLQRVPGAHSNLMLAKIASIFASASGGNLWGS